jgi:hypothetical protein
MFSTLFNSCMAQAKFSAIAFGKWMVWRGFRRDGTMENGTHFAH